MTRQVFIERLLRQIYNGQPTDDSTITINLVNAWLPEAVGLAAQKNYKDNLAIDGISYINGSFYSTFKGISITKDEQFLWKFTLPEIPVGIGANMGISTLQLKDSQSNITLPCIPITENQKTFFQTMRPIPNKTLYYYEGGLGYIKSTLLLSQYSATMAMISGGDSTNLASEINIPPDYLPVVTEYVTKMLSVELQQPVDTANDGAAIR